MTFNAIDIVLVVLVLLSALNGWRRGFIMGLLDLLGWILSLVAGLRFYQPVARWLGARVDLWSEVWDQPLAFILIAASVAGAVHLLSYAFLRRLSEDVHERSLNRLFGLIPGLANGLITAAIVAALLLSVPLHEGLSERARSSALVNRLAVYTERLENALHPVFGDAIARTLNLLTVQPDSDERVNLPFTVPVSRPRPDLEAEMLRLVNTERIAAGLGALAADPELTEVARSHSADMFARGYFAHDTPEGRDPFDRIRAADVRFLTAGENLALARTVQIAHTGLMNSPGHRANILRPEFGRVGIGIMDGGMRGVMVTQNFRN
ncbi:MAG: CvpA family protein [Pyrinomonadaceae bacterium]|nr:CvpA family protein [Pyrinomonadaceae bacterium]MBA3571182.1 CvpA family protein [Pyrinomonadaceae bacterium]MDQ3173660.1 CvpA family protein [Acidobacteriota bacterium]